MKINIGDRVLIKKGTWFSAVFYIGDVTGVVCDVKDDLCRLSIDDEHRLFFTSNGYPADYFPVQCDDLIRIKRKRTSGWQGQLIEMLGM